MDAVVAQLDDWLRILVDLAILLFEYVGVGILVVTGVIAVISYIRRDPFTRLKLAKGLAMGLEFKLGSEILRTVIVRQASEVLIVGAIIVLRAALTFLIHWEIKTEESAHEAFIERNQLHEGDEGNSPSKDQATTNESTKT